MSDVLFIFGDWPEPTNGLWETIIEAASVEFAQVERMHPLPEPSEDE